MFRSCWGRGSIPLRLALALPALPGLGRGVEHLIPILPMRGVLLVIAATARVGYRVCGF